MNRKHLLAGVVLSLGLAWGLQAQSPDDFRFIDKALALQATDVYQSSLLLEDMAARQPKWDYPRILLGELYERFHLVSRAVSNYEKALGMLSQEALKPEIQYRLALGYLKLGDSGTAQAWLSRIDMGKVEATKRTEVDAAKNLLANFQVAERLVAREDRRAEELLKSIISENELIFAAYILLGQYYENRGQTEEAIKVYEAASVFPAVKSVAVAGLVKSDTAGVYRMIRDPEVPGRWNLSVQLPRGTYDYRFLRNWQFPDEMSLPDPSGGKVYKGEKGLQYNKLTVKRNIETVSFSYQFLDRDKLFDHYQNRIAKIRTRALIRSYPSKLFNIKDDGEGGVPVTFRYYDPYAYAVWAVGSFNRFGFSVSESSAIDPKFIWPLAGPDKNGWWTLSVNTPPGEYFYNLVVNESTVVRDPLLIGRLDYTKQLVDDLTAKLPKQDEQSGVSTKQGVIEQGAQVLFVFNPEDYKQTPSRVLVAGSFNNWITFKADAAQVLKWSLKYDDEKKLWKLAVPARLIPPNAEFKFVINENQWQNPPSGIDINYLSRDKTNLKVNFGYKPDVKAANKGLEVKSFNVWAQFSRVALGDLKDVKFVYNNTAAKSLRISGDFNEWNKYYKYLIPDYNLIPDGDGNWRVTLRLPAGNYEFKYVVDGFNWVYDPLYKSKRSDNSEIEVR